MSGNFFSLQYYRDFLETALKENYVFLTLRQFYDRGCPPERHFVIRHDLDRTPLSLTGVVGVEDELGIQSTIFVRVTANEYNPFSYIALPTLKSVSARGFEIGLHTNFLEFATINQLDPLLVLRSELQCLRSFFPEVDSLSCHRDINYQYNSLPWLVERWPELRRKLCVHYHAYEEAIMGNTVYVNESLSPHLGWGKHTPEAVIQTGRSICLLTHPYWWFSIHPFELMP
jgi:hypothetical protein